jgi:hypothetical protein
LICFINDERADSRFVESMRINHFNGFRNGQRPQGVRPKESLSPISFKHGSPSKTTASSEEQEEKHKLPRTDIFVTFNELQISLIHWPFKICLDGHIGNHKERHLFSRFDSRQYGTIRSCASSGHCYR